jgi:hypothetical protein
MCHYLYLQLGTKDRLHRVEASLTWHWEQFLTQVRVNCLIDVDQNKFRGKPTACTYVGPMHRLDNSHRDRQLRASDCIHQSIPILGRLDLRQIRLSH